MINAKKLAIPNKIVYVVYVVVQIDLQLANTVRKITKSDRRPPTELVLIFKLHMRHARREIPGSSSHLEILTIVRPEINQITFPDLSSAKLKKLKS